MKLRKLLSLLLMVCVLGLLCTSCATTALDNINTYCALHDAIRERWGARNAVLAFAPDHGCHRQYGFLGQHGIDDPSDMHIWHFWKFFPARQAQP